VAMKDYYKEEKSGAPKAIGLIILIFFVFMLGWNAGINHVEQNKVNPAKNYALSTTGELEQVNMQLFWDTWNILFAKFVDPHLLDTQTMIYGAIRGMVASLDDAYTTFMTPKENREFQEGLEGTLEGIGAELTLRNQFLTVVSPLKNSPAQQAGLQPEDIIYKIDGELTEDFTLEQAVLKIRGPRGTRVTLTIVRKGHDEPFDLQINRKKINIASVEWEFKKDFSYISINQFGNNLIEEWSQVINQVLSQRPKGIILDLRYNGGGYLDGAVDIASEFIEKGLVVSIKRRNPEENEEIYVNGKARLATPPLAVLINKGSASASEIVAGAIQDHKRGYVIGESSFGKGTVQEVVNLIGGSSLRVTVAKWYTPENRNITETGITPDQTVERTPEDFEKNFDPQLEAAIEYLNTKK
ncbi:MAG: S41 family peptidase, partial [Candidatus Peregrinibacteria bacterium]